MCGTIVPQRVDLLVACGCGVTTLSGGSQQRGTRMISKECPRGARMALKDYGDNEAVRSRGQDLVSTYTVIKSRF